MVLALTVANWICLICFRCYWYLFILYYFFPYFFVKFIFKIISQVCIAEYSFCLQHHAPNNNLEKKLLIVFFSIRCILLNMYPLHHVSLEYTHKERKRKRESTDRMGWPMMIYCLLSICLASVIPTLR